jgi:hypothetical protein
LIKKKPMKPTTLIVLTLAGVTTTGCMASVGGDECTSDRCQAGDDAGTGSGRTVDCDDPEVLTTNLVISSDADFRNIPSHCWTLNANLRMEGTAITSLDKLGALTEVNNLELVGTSLTAVDTQQTLKVYGDLLVSSNTKLTNIDKLDVRRWDGQTSGEAFSVGYTIRDNAELTSLEGMRYIPQVDKDLVITNNPKLATLELTELTKVNGALTISGIGANTINVSHLSSVGSIEISSNSALTTISGLATTVIYGNVTLRGNAHLATVGSMSSLTQITGNLIVDDNDALTTLAGLAGSAMQRISGSVTVTGNAALADLGQLSHLTQGIGSTVSISNNTALETCLAVELDRCVQSSTVTITGNKNASTNKSNCAAWCN